MSQNRKVSAIPNPRIIPRIIIHGGAGNLTRKTIPRDRYDAYQASLTKILAQSADLLAIPGMTALDVAAHAVSLLENDPLYNSGKGAVFTREGKNELECSIMVSNGYKKRGVSCMMLKHVKNPIKLARELLIRGEKQDGDGAKDHCQYSGEFVEKLAAEWGLEIVGEDYFFTQQRWDEHKRGLAEEKKRQVEELSVPTDEMSEWEKENYIPLGTCGAVVLDSFGTVCTATSTGGLTNKVPGRIGDTPTTGAGFWAEEWSSLETESTISDKTQMLYQSPSSSAPSPIDKLSRGDIGSLVSDCLPSFTTTSSSLSSPPPTNPTPRETHTDSPRSSSIRLRQRRHLHPPLRCPHRSRQIPLHPFQPPINGNIMDGRTRRSTPTIRR
ncbi:hypothetical protein N0V83_001629 [Neocucurbitaria cava]|uniref:L-asparaginase n=1 Tax=Neocucurbitaria cava TaxID=798079 RepID=A0A9W8YF88_9PLEO|nr:hypothetical protein N0V83_001629 [Neocucurbitaria cava]